MNKERTVSVRGFYRILNLMLLIAMLAGCGSKAPATPGPTSTEIPTATPRPTGTPVPARPVIAYTAVPADTLSPIIIQRSPQRGQALAPNGEIEIVFDKPMDQQAVAKAFRMERAGTSDVVAGTLAWADARTVQFKPQAALDRGASYDVILTQDAQASSGEPLSEPFVFRFATAGDLEVAQVMPEAGTTEVEADTVVTVIFNRPVVPLTPLAQMRELPQPLSFDPPIAGSGEWLNTSIYIFTPDAPFAGGITYRATIAAGLQDISGAALPSDYVWHFTTAAPAVTWVTPREQAKLADINTAITVQFNQPVDPTSARNAFRLQGEGLLAGAVRGQFDIQGATLIFTPTQALGFDTRYTVSVDAGVTSTAGGRGMATSYTWQFTTVPLPRIVETDPRDGEREAPPHTPFRIVFNAPIDPATVMPNLTITPGISATDVHTYYSTYDNTFVLYFGAKPSTDYQVVIENGIADPYGNTIPRGRTVRFRTAPLPPDYQLRVPDFVATYDAGLPAQVAVAYVNLDRLSFRLYRLSIQALQESPWYWQDNNRVPERSALLREWQVALESPLNEQRNAVVGLAESPNDALAPGVYLLDIDAPGVDQNRYWRPRRHILVVSELNLTLKSAPTEVMVWATDLATGAPVPNLNLSIHEYQRGERGTLMTDAQGYARYSLARDRSGLVVHSQTPFAAASSDWGRGIRAWDFGVSDGVAGQTHRVHVYTDRAIYRPGQTVYLKGALRDEQDAVYSLSNLSQVQVTIRDYFGQELYAAGLPLSDLGTFETQLELPAGAGLGEYVITTQVNDVYSQSYFTVAAYRPPEFEVKVEADREEIQRGDSLNATITLSYFFGGPLRNTPVTWNLLAESYSFEPTWGGNYTFSDNDDPYRCFHCWWWDEPAAREPVLSGQGVTDGAGRLTVALNGNELATALDKGAQRLILQATATGPDNQEIAGRTAVIAHPGPYYIGLRPRAYVGRAGNENATELVVVDWDGNRLTNQAVKVTFYLREWINTFVENEMGGGRWSWETKETQVAETTVTTNARGEAVATFVPEQGGSYRVVAETAEPNARTREIRSSIFVWISGPDYISWRRENHDRITLISDKSAYDVGETAEILIPSPFEAPHWALVTVEREGVRRYEILRLETNSTIYRLPIEANDIPNVYVSVVLIKARDNQAAAFKMGVLPLDVRPTPRMLTVRVEADRDRAGPGEEVTYTLTALGPGGQPVPGAELSLDLVDKAILSLKPRANTILDAFYSRRMLQVDTSSGLSISGNLYLQELYEELDLGAVDDAMDGGDMARSAMGYGEAEMMAEEPMPMATMSMMDQAKSEGAALPEGVDVRQEFADTAHWTPRLITDAQGRAVVTLTLPDNLTTWVARGVGLTAETWVGEGTSELIATQPLLVRPVAPRFFVVDDRVQLAANVSNNTDETLTVDVGLTVRGVTISTETPALQTVTIPAQGETQVTWWVVATDVPHTELIFSASSGSYADASKPRLTTGPDGTLFVLRYTAPDTVGTAGQLTEGGARTEAIALPPAFDDRRGQLTVQLDPSLAAGMQEGLDYLEHFEYESTETTVSRFLPNVLTYRALQALSIENPELNRRLPSLVEEGLSNLYSGQNPDGGWGWWWYGFDEPRSNAHISAYVVFALIKAEEAGFSVKSEVLSRGVSYLQSQIKGIRELQHTYDANRQAWLLYVLTEAGAVNRGALNELFDNRDKLSHYARAYLAQSLAIIDTRDARLATLLSDLNNAAILSATGAHWEEAHHDWWAMNTDTRSTAIVLDTLAKLDPDNQLIPNAVRWLMIARQVGVWETTQETAWALIALTNWMVVTGELDAAYDFAFYLNDIEQARATVTRETVQTSTKAIIPLIDLNARETNALTLARTEGPGRLYYTAHLQVYLPVDQIDAEDRGFVVYRRYTQASCEAEDRRECPEVREAKLGDVIRVDLTLITPHDRYYVVVEDPLPAGGEAIDTGLATTSLLAMSPRLERQNSRWWWWWNWYSRSELRDEKVVLFADYLAAGTYEYSYTFRATLPGDYHVIPTTATETYFPEVFGRSDGRLLRID
jgi:alpha-2-macroglobulin